MTISPALKMARDELIFNKLANEEKARERARQYEIAKEQAEAEAERMIRATDMEATAGVARTFSKVKPKSRKTYGKKNYTNAKGYPRKPRTYG